ncbi:epoxide hydrolase [Kribbella capetownensis]|uniref:Epoxide hydrolase n=1 Tax=Kribbella capetownensis TaxID=1572659 RepID=A0A4R0JJ26_9ACTN|nr:epoxide hydrolase family protein [Kribbella capetownensis]TCC45724.1 epoxide hydrolase [Kribbella capetownensis]
MIDFRIDVPDAALEDLAARLRRIRWPRQLPGSGWHRGVPLEYLQGIVARWQAYDWRAWEARLNAYPQYTTRIDEQTIHFLHARSPEADALPLILTHGWPGSVAEFLPLLGPLTDPASYGGDPRDAFHVVAPSVPGHGFSVPLESPGWNHRRIAQAWAVLMQELGYQRYGAQGGDTGSVVSPLLGYVDPSHVVGVHINGGLAFPPLVPGDAEHLTDVERERLAAAERLREVGTGYAELQGTRPQTVSFGLSDSPVGQLAWILEKFWEWTDPARALPEDAVDLDHLLTDASIYWFTNTSASSANLYFENRVAADEVLEPSGVPTGVAVFPTDPAIRRVLDRRHRIVHWSEFDRGGHFAALEAPDLLVDDIRAFFRLVR